MQHQIKFRNFIPSREIKIKTYRLAQRPALANGNLVTLLHTESRRHVSGEVLVALLVPVVLGNVVEVLAADDDGTVHLGGNDGAGQDTATDRDHTSEGALLVCTAKQKFQSTPCSKKVPMWPSSSCSPRKIHLLIGEAWLSSSSSSRGIGASRSARECVRLPALFWGSRTDVLALNGSFGGLETQTNVLVPSPTALARPGRLDLGLAVEEDYKSRVAVVSARALSPILHCNSRGTQPF